MLRAYTKASSDPFAPNLEGPDDTTLPITAPGPRDEKHQHIRFWEHAEYKPYAKRGPKHHVGQSAEGVDIYLERLDGSTITRVEYTELRTVFKRHVNTLQQHGRAAATWTSLSKEAHNYICRGMRKAFEGFDYCDDKKWKLQVFGVLVYPDAMRDREVNDGKSKKRAISVLDIDDDDDDIELELRTTKKAKHAKGKERAITQGMYC